MTTPSEACFWIIGRDTENPAIAVDLHDDQGNVIGETHTESLRGRWHTLEIAQEYAARHGILPAAVFFDEDSTECCAKD